MNDFNYEIERTDHYFFESFTVDGKSVQNGTPTPDEPVEIQVVQAPDGGTFGISFNGTITPIDLNGNVLASLPDGTKDALTVDSVGHVVLEKRVGIAEMATLGFAKSNDGEHTASVNLTNAIGYPSGQLELLMSNEYYRGTYAGRTSNGNMYRAGNWLIITNTACSTTEEFTTALADAVLYYPLATPTTIDLGYIDISSLQDIETEIPITLIASLETETEYSYNNKPTYQVENPYENADAPEYAYPPNHFGQEWETFDANDWNDSEMLDYTGQMESHAVYTVELCELMQSGAFNWKRPELDWSEAAYNAEQYERFCKYFEQRFMFREISMLPPLHWFTALKRMMVYELMPKYKPLYAQIENGISPLGENEYYKERHVSSSYPETLLSGNSDYISSGEDREFERIKVDNAAEALESYRNGFRSVDAALGDELEVLFISMYTSFVNAF